MSQLWDPPAVCVAGMGVEMCAQDVSHLSVPSTCPGEAPVFECWIMKWGVSTTLATLSHGGSGDDGIRIARYHVLSASYVPGTVLPLPRDLFLTAGL